MFGKKKEDENGAGVDANKPSGDTNDVNAHSDESAAPPLKPFSRKGSHAPAKPPTPSGASLPELPRRTADIPGVGGRRLDRPRTGEAESRRLIVGRDIMLNGEITECDKLIVEGHVEVALPGARVLEISPSGLFKGSAEVDEADISGRFEGDLTARDRLVIRAGGRVNGKVRYGKIVIESGGEIAGDMQTLNTDETGTSGEN